MPVWVNVREEALPPLPAPLWHDVLGVTTLDAQNRVVDAASKGFFLRSLVLTPDGQHLLNKQTGNAHLSLQMRLHEGYFAYAQTLTEDYLPMLQAALSAQRACPVPSGTAHE